MCNHFLSASYLRDQRINFLAGLPPPYVSLTNKTRSILTYLHSSEISLEAPANLNSWGAARQRIL